MKVLFQTFFAYALRALAWEDSKRPVAGGVKIAGDPRALPSSPNKLKMLRARLSWKMVAVVTVNSNNKPFYAGFKNEWGQVFICQRKLTGKGFRAMVGHEAVTFFAIDELGTELVIENATTMSKEAANIYEDADFPRV